MAAWNLTVATFNDQIVNVEVDGNTAIDDLKAILEAETGIPSASQALFLGTRVLPDGQTLSAAGVSNGDVLQLMPAQQPRQQGGQGRGGGGQAAGQAPAMKMNPDGTAANPIAMMQALRSDPGQLALVEQSNPKLAKCIRDEDVAGFQEEMRRVASAQKSRDQQLEEYYRLADADPFNVEVQKKIEELIQQKNIEENMEQALEHAPEVFGTVSMLYVDMIVNGVHCKVFVDSGAQMTIMTQDFAERCHLARLIDKRFQGVAVGVGSSKIIGRIHQAPLKVGEHFISTSITVLEQRGGPQFILGLDNLKRHQCCIDLMNNQLRIGSCGATLSFLSEHEIPKDFSKHVEDVTEDEASAEMSKAEPSGAAPMDVAGTSAPAEGAPGTSAAPAPPAPAPAPAAAADPMEEKVQKLMALGFDRAHCVQALQACGGNEELAASMLFG